MTLPTSRLPGDTITAADINAIAEAVNDLGSGGGGGGGGSSAVRFVHYGTATSSGSVPTSDALLPGLTLTLPGGADEAVWLVSMTLFTDGHANRLSLWLDSSAVIPSQAIGHTLTQTGTYGFSVADYPVSVPGDSSSHTLEVRWQATDSTSAVSLLRRSLVAKQLAGSASPTTIG